MEKRALLNRIRSLSNIDGHLLPELTSQQQARFLADPIGYFLLADDTQADAIMREVEARQTEALKSFAAAPAKSKKIKARTPGQREMLLPIRGSKAEEENVAPVFKPLVPRRAG